MLAGLGRGDDDDGLVGLGEYVGQSLSWATRAQRNARAKSE